MNKESAQKMKTRYRRDHNSTSSMTPESPATVKDGRTGRTKRKASPEQETPKTTKKRRLNQDDQLASSSVDTKREISSTRSAKRKAADEGEAPSRKKRKRSPSPKETRQTTEQAAQLTSKQTTRKRTEKTTRRGTNQATKRGTNRATKRGTNLTTKRGTNLTTKRGTNRATKRGTNQRAKKTTERLTQLTSKQTTKHSTKTTTEQATEQGTNQGTKETTEHSTQHSNKQTTKHSTDQTTKEGTNQTNNKTTEHSTQCSNKQTTKHSTDQTTKEGTNQTNNKTTEHSTQCSNKQTTKHSTDQTTKEGTNQTNNKTTEHSTEPSPQQDETALSPRAKFEAKYKEQCLLGAGGCGYVMAGYRKADNLPVAVKHISKESVPCKHEDDNGNQVSVEVAIMEKLTASGSSGSVGTSAPVSLLDWYDLDQELILVMEKPVSCVDLFTYIQANRGSLGEEKAKIILKQLVKAAKELEDQQIFHRDIKTENILIETGSDFPRVRLIDFGLGCFAERTSVFCHFYGTPAVCPPEWLRYFTYWAGSTTVWQVGTVLFDLVHNKAQFDTIKFIRNQLKIQSGLSENCMDFLERCLDMNPKRRPTLEQLQHHPWLR